MTAGRPIPNRRDVGARGASVERGARVRAGWISLVLGTLVFAGKLAAYAATGSTAVFSDAMESVVNVVAAGLLLYSVIVASRPADRSHPYGHGKVEFFSAGVEGTLIAVAAALILFEAGREILLGPKLRRLDVGLVAVTLLAAVNAGLGLFLVREGRRTGSLALLADGQHVLTDVVTSVGVVVGLALVWATGWTIFDPLVAIAVAMNILRTGVALLRGAVGGLMDEADDALLGSVVEGLEKEHRPFWIDVHTLRAWRSGALPHVDLHMVVPRYFDADRLHRIDDEVTERVAGALGVAGDVIVHFDPCRPRHCPGCAIEGCPVRAAPFGAREPLTLDRATREDEPP
jgi:cation diffusion facilitator family transporter